MASVNVPLGDRSYAIQIGPRLLPGLGEACSRLKLGHRCAIICDTNVGKRYAKIAYDSLLKDGFEPCLIIVPAGESAKSLKTVQSCYDRLAANRLERKSFIVALGGGVVGDLAGFVAATYLRGIDFVQVPTTLLSQVDSSVGGKTAINHPLGKNMIGAFYQPQRVVCDLNTLQSLPQRELSAGLAEVIKYGPIADMQFLDWLDQNLDALMARDPKALGYAVQRSCEIKAYVVSQDERDVGMRAALNFGHTFGHAIEAGLGFGEWLHGEAVGCGMVMAANLSQRLGLVDKAFVQRLTHLIDRAGLPVVGPKLGADNYLQHMRVDKKAQSGEIRFVLIDPPGKAIVRGAPDTLVADVINHCCAG